MISQPRSSLYIYIFSLTVSILGMSILDLIKSHYTKQWTAMGIDIVILFWIPLSICINATLLCRYIGSQDILPTIRLKRTLEPNFVIPLGFGHAWLMFSRFLYGIFNVSASVAGSTSTSSDNPASISCAPPLLFAFHHIPIALSLSFVMVLFLGKYFELSGINQDRWGSFHILYQLVTLLLRIAVTILQWMNALLDGRIRRVDVIRT
ncbi:hypothetical protein F5879DRAFT_541292 [Lentinula edodes]|nr:hypothetical protein F5051DRAFT_214071 [Lentinula edodes]KAJ3899075.1 hypothetical protein F5879DRAFT_541292 [Lentinula edodes]